MERIAGLCVVCVLCACLCVLCVSVCVVCVSEFPHETPMMIQDTGE